MAAMPIMTCHTTMRLSANAAVTWSCSGSGSEGIAGMAEYAMATPPGKALTNSVGRRLASCVCRTAVPMVMPPCYHHDY